DLLPLLHLVQSEEGYVTEDGVLYCADRLGLAESEVASVVSFYTMFKRHPVGQYHVGVCTNTLCAIMGGDQILADLREHLGVADDEATPDGKVSLEHVECNAACDYAPVVMVNWEFFDNMTPDSARELVDDLRSGAPGAGWAGAQGVSPPGSWGPPRRGGRGRARGRGPPAWSACGSPGNTAGRPRRRRPAPPRPARGAASDRRVDARAHGPLGR